MILLASRQQALARRREYVTPGGAVTFVSTYLGTNKMELAAGGAVAVDVTAAGPMAYLVEQTPHSHVDAHYHQADQFQLFVSGSGRIGTHRVERVTVHYAGAHSPYGPIVAGPEGVAYVTLRRTWDPGAQWMPGAAAALRAKPDRRHVAFTSEPLTPPRNLREARGTTVAEVMPCRDGAGAWLVQAAPGATVRADPSAGSGLFWYVVDGELQVEGEALAAGGCLFMSGDEAPREASAGVNGVEIVQVQFASAQA